jgi:chromate transporter
MSQIPALIRVFAYLSLLTVGGGMAAFPELQTLTVDVHHWLTQDQLIHLYSLGQMAPGPNMMMIVPVGDWTAGVAGSLVVLVASRMVNGMGAVHSIQQGLAPVSIGLLLAGCFSMAKGAITGVETAAIAVAVLMTLLRFRINPALLIIGGAVLGWMAFDT